MKKIYFLISILLFSQVSFGMNYFIYTKKNSNLPNYTFKGVKIINHTPYFFSDYGLYYLNNEKFKGWNSQNSELNNDFITDISFRDDNIYISTPSGLYEFNGILTFKHYSKENSNLPDDFIQKLIFSPDKKTLFLASKNKLITYSGDLWNEIKTKEEIGIISDMDFYNNSLFVLTSNGLYKMGTKEITLFSPPWLGKKKVKTVVSHNKKLYLGTNSGLIIWNGSSIREELEGFNISCLAIDKTGKAWVAGNGFMAYENIHGWENLGSSIPIIMQSNIISLDCNYNEKKQLITVYTILQSKGILKINTYTSEELNTIEKLSNQINDEMARKNFRKAEEIANQIIKYNPNHINTLKILANIYLTEEDYSRFFKTFSKIIELSPADAINWYPAIASIYLDHGHYMAAAYILRILSRGNDYSSIEKLAKIYENTTHFYDAIICQKKLFSIKKNINPLFSLSRLYEKEGDLDNAEAMLRKAVNEFPNTDTTYLELSRFYLRYQRADLTLIEKILSKAMEINPQNPSTYALLGYIKTLRGKFVNAESTLFKAIRIAPNNGEARLYLANLYFIGHKTLLLKQQMAECERLIPNSPEFNLLKGQILAFNGSFQKAIDVLQKVVTAQPYNAIAHFYLAKSYHSARFFKSAIMEYKNTLKLSPNFKYKAEILEALAKLTG